MKLFKMKTLLLTVLMGFVFTTAEAQKTKDNIFSDDDLVFFGLDFSHARMIGSAGFNDPYAIKNTYFHKWNRLLYAEKEKYNLEKYYRKSNVEYDFSVVDVRNDKVDEDEMVIDKSYKIEKETLTNIISEYDSEDTKKGLGVVYIIESFNKTEGAGFIWVTFFDIQTKKILMARRMKGNARGFGFRNFWAAPFYDILKQTDRLWKTWKKS